MVFLAVDAPTGKPLHRLRSFLTGRPAAVVAWGAALTQVVALCLELWAYARVGDPTRVDLLAADLGYALAIKLCIAANLGMSCVVVGLALAVPKRLAGSAWLAAGLLLLTHLMLNWSDVVSTQAGIDWVTATFHPPEALSEGFAQTCFIIVLDGLQAFSAWLFAAVLWRCACRRGRPIATLLSMFAAWAAVDLFFHVVWPWDIDAFSEGVFVLMEAWWCAAAGRWFWAGAGLLDDEPETLPQPVKASPPKPTLGLTPGA